MHVQILDAMNGLKTRMRDIHKNDIYAALNYKIEFHVLERKLAELCQRGIIFPSSTADHYAFL